MPRIPNDLLERIKHETPLRLLVERSGVALKVSGENLLGLCPMHDDHDPSLVLTPSRGLWHCLGACQAGGTVIDWVMKADGLDFREAVDKLLAEFFPLEAASLVGARPSPSCRARSISTPTTRLSSTSTPISATSSSGRRPSRKSMWRSGASRLTSSSRTSSSATRTARSVFVSRT